MRTKQEIIKSIKASPYLKSKREPIFRNLNRLLDDIVELIALDEWH